MKNLVVRVPVTESEKGWGRKIDDYMICLTLKDGLKFTKEFNSKNTDISTPDWYMKVEHEPEPFDINDLQLKELRKRKNKRMWQSEIKNFKNK